MAEIDNRIKQNAISYFKASREAEDGVQKYTRVKYDADISFEKRSAAYDSMMTLLLNLSKCETTYKETVDGANNYIQEFRKEMLKACKKLRNLEEPRVEAIHSIINQFVVFEQSAEMNNKYDLGNFAKILEQFSAQEEMNCIDEHLYGISANKLKVD